MENLFEGTPVFFQVLVAGLGLAIVVVIGYTLLYVADEIEDSAAQPVGRLLKAIVGGLAWALVGVPVSAGLFLVALGIWYLFFRPLFPYYVLRYNAIFVSYAIIFLYFLWGLYHGARNKLPISYRYDRHAAHVTETG